MTNAVELAPSPQRGMSEAKEALGWGQEKGREASDLTCPNPMFLRWVSPYGQFYQDTFRPC